jgi:hypothetical protein
MRDSVGVWLQNSGWLSKASARTPALRRSILSWIPLDILRSLEQIPVSICHGVFAFLTGSGSHSECDVTHSKQTTEKFLTGARTHIKHSGCCNAFSPFFSTEIAIRVANFPSKYSLSVGHNLFPGLMLDSENVFL